MDAFREWRDAHEAEWDAERPLREAARAKLRELADRLIAASPQRRGDVPIRRQPQRYP